MSDDLCPICGEPNCGPAYHLPEGSAPREPQATGGSTRLFQIKEPDLAELERLAPVIAHAAFFSRGPRNDARLRTQVRRVKDILSHVRWNYGPPSDIQIIPADGPLPGDDPDE